MRNILLTLAFVLLSSPLFSQTYTPHTIEFYNIGEMKPIYTTSSDVSISVEKNVVSINNRANSVFDIKKMDKGDYTVVERGSGRIAIISITKDAIAINYGTYILQFLYKPKI